MNRSFVLFSIFVFLFLSLFWVDGIQSQNQSQSVDVIYGWVKRADGTPMPDVQVWHCISSVPEPFPSCVAREFVKTSNSGRWLSITPPLNTYLRIWATYPNSYSQTITKYYSGGDVYWGDLNLYGNPPPSGPSLRIISPNGGEKIVPGSALKINWAMHNAPSGSLANVVLFRSDYNPERPSICNLSANCTQSSYNWVANIAYKTANDGEVIWTVPKSSVLADNYFIRIVCYDSASGFCGEDDSDAPFSIISGSFSVEPVAETSLAPVPPPVSNLTSLPIGISVKGVVKSDQGLPGNALIWAWSDKGSSVSLTANQGGDFVMLLTRGDRWHVSAAKEINGVLYKDMRVFEIASDAVNYGPLDLILTSVSGGVLSDPVVLTMPASEEIIALVSDGAKVIIPPSGAVLTGKITLNIQPEVGAASFLEEVPTFLKNEVVSTIYDIIIRDEQGREIKEFQKEIEITIPYKDEDLKKQGIGEDKIYPAYFDEAGDVWVKIENYSLDKEKKLILARVKHLTRFAIVAPADVSPPEAPSNKTAVAMKDGSIKLSWVNPKRDFHHVKIYRSETSKAFGLVAFNDLTGTSILDKSVIGGKTYYYLIRSIDPAGNESENTVQLSVKTSSVVLKPAPSILAEEKATPEPVKEIVPLAMEVSSEPQVPPLAEAESPIEKPGFFMRIWQAIWRLVRSIF